MDTNPLVVNSTSWVKIANSGDTFYIRHATGAAVYLAATDADSAPGIVDGEIPLTPGALRVVTSADLPSSYVWAKVNLDGQPGTLSVTK